MDYLSLIKQPIEAELKTFIDEFEQALTHEDGLLEQALAYIRQRSGKRMRPMLIMLIAKNFGPVVKATYDAAIGLELLHTASLVHDDVVDESEERRGQPSVNASFDNKVAVLVGDYVLSTAMLRVCATNNLDIVSYISHLGQVLSDGEILQLSNTLHHDFSEDVYYNVIKRKTAALFEACAVMGAMSMNAPKEVAAEAAKFGQNLGIAFQIRDDIFDYFDAKNIGKPTGNDMREGKLTLPVLFALNSTRDDEMLELAKKVKDLRASDDDIARLVDFTKANGGIEYAEISMNKFRKHAQEFVDKYITDSELAAALTSYLDFVVDRNM